MRIVILSDIHANVTALSAVLKDVGTLGRFDAYAILGDLINYGPRPNEVIEIIGRLPQKILVNLWGNHEYSIFEGRIDRFATDRGRSILAYTNSILTEDAKSYLNNNMIHSGLKECLVGDKRFLFIHGNLDDPYWGKLTMAEMMDNRYAKYEYVISGHLHVPHYVENFFSSESIEYRNKKRTVFINPGAVGQPRNHNPMAQYGILDSDTGNYEHRSVWYDVAAEQKLFCDNVDKFYKERLTFGV